MVTKNTDLNSFINFVEGQTVTFEQRVSERLDQIEKRLDILEKQSMQIREDLVWSLKNVYLKGVVY